MSEQRSVVAGFPEFWHRVYEKYSAFFEAAKELETLQNWVIQKPVRETLHKVLGRIAVSVSNSFGALITLALNGYGVDAMKIARNMFEAELTAAYLRRHPDEIADYVDFLVIGQKGLYDYMVKFAPHMLERIPTEKISEMEQKLSKVAPRFREGNRLRNRWTKTSIQKMAEEAGLIQLYLTFCSWASSMHHVDIGGLVSQVEEETLDADVAPSEEWLDIALISGHGAVIRTLDCYNEVAQLGMEKEIQAAIDRFKKAWQER